MSTEKPSRPAADFNIKKFMEGQAYLTMRAQMQAEINCDTIKIDYSCFKKTPLERDQLKQAKHDYKKWLKTNGTVVTTNATTVRVSQ